MLVCDYCGEAWHVSCGNAALGASEERYWYCNPCKKYVREHNVRDLTLDDTLLDYLEKGTPPPEEELDRILRASAFLKWEDDTLWINKKGNWLNVPSIA